MRILHYRHVYLISPEFTKLSLVDAIVAVTDISVFVSNIADHLCRRIVLHNYFLETIREFVTTQIIRMTMTANSKQGSKRSKWALDFAHKYVT